MRNIQTDGNQIVENIKALFCIETLKECACIMGCDSSWVSHIKYNRKRLTERNFLFLCIEKDMPPEQMFYELGLPQDYFTKE